MTLNETFEEINYITVKLIELGLTVQQNYPYRSGSSIFCRQGVDLSKVLRNVSYVDKYTVTNRDGNYNFKLLDGAIVQLMYRFEKNQRDLISHRLAFLPSPHLKDYETDPGIYESLSENTDYLDIIESNVIKIPIRFDYNTDEKIFKDLHHPKSHLHLGEYEKCRIPVHCAISPSAFLNFILRNFYNTALVDYCYDYSFPVKQKFPQTLSQIEREFIHLRIN